VWAEAIDADGGHRDGAALASLPDLVRHRRNSPTAETPATTQMTSSGTVQGCRRGIRVKSPRRGQHQKKLVDNNAK
jgi:hypothetical protein